MDAAQKKTTLDKRIYPVFSRPGAYYAPVSSRHREPMRPGKTKRDKARIEERKRPLANPVLPESVRFARASR